MTGISTPTYESVAESIADAVKGVAGMPATVVHKEQKIQLTQEGLKIDGYDYGKGAIYYAEVRGPLSGDDIEIPARDYFIDPTLWEVWLVFGFSNRMADGRSSTEVWRGEVQKIRDVLRKNQSIMGDVHKAPRGTAMPENGIARFFNGALVHVTRIRLFREVITEIAI